METSLAQLTRYCRSVTHWFPNLVLGTHHQSDGHVSMTNKLGEGVLALFLQLIVREEYVSTHALSQSFREAHKFLFYQISPGIFLLCVLRKSIEIWLAGVSF